MADMNLWLQELQRVLDTRGLAQHSWVLYEIQCLHGYG
jgi:hypothetical protein